MSLFIQKPIFAYREVFRKGDRVQILSNQYPEVQAGTVGKVDCRHQGGYGVKVDQDFELPEPARGAKGREVRIIWYAPEHLEKA